MKNKVKILLLIFLFSLFISPQIVSAAKVSMKTKNVGTYHTSDYDPERENVYRFDIDGGSAFCVEPGQAVHSGNDFNVADANSASAVADHLRDNYPWQKNMTEKKYEDLMKVLSCWSDNDNSIYATQAIVWELISNERSSINATNILGGNYKSKSTISGTISNRICSGNVNNNDSDLCSNYRATLRCAARFNVTPSFAIESTNQNNRETKLSSDKNYNAETQTFSKTFKHTGLDSSLLKYYEIKSDSGLEVTNTKNSITVSTTQEIAKSSAKRITLTYAKKDNENKLNNDKPKIYYGTVGGSHLQSLLRGSTTKTVYMYIYTDKKPTYQLRVRKVDENGNPVSGVKFNIYSDSSLKNKVGTTTASDKNGWAELKNIKKIGTYYAKEAETPDGYITNNEKVKIKIGATHITNSGKWPTAEKVFTNKFMHLSLSKRTIDDTGKEIEISDYTEKSCAGDYIGPVFTLKKDNKYVCVTPISGKPGKYKLASSCDVSGATKEIKTCDGKFDIEGIKSGCYDITETSAPDGYTLPKNPTQHVCVTKGQSATATVMYNGVTGVIFNKVTENGNPIDGGKFALQQKINGIYRDMLLKHDTGAIYVYEKDLKEESESVSYVLETSNGTINVKNLPPGEYRFVEKQAPEGYDAIKDKDSKATFTISDKGIFGSNGNPVTDYYQVKMVNQQTRVEGSYDSAELIVTIITGRKVANYTLIIAGLAVLLTIFIILRNKLKK